jgi:hypothetical protein
MYVFCVDGSRALAGGVHEAILQPGPPVATLPLPPRSPYDTPALSDVLEKQKHRQLSAWRRANRSVVSGNRKKYYAAVRSSKSVHKNS